MTKTDSPPQKSWFKRHPVWSGVLGFLVLLLVFLALMAFLPVKVSDTSVSNPAGSHDEAIARIDAIREAEQASGEINPVCLSTVMTHGEKT